MNAAKRTAKLHAIGRESGKYVGCSVPHYIKGKVVRAFFRAMCGAYLSHRKGWRG